MEEKGLIVLEEINAVELFTKDGGADIILENLKTAFNAFVPDLTTGKGRDEIKSYARKFSTSKVAIVAEHKKLVADEKEKLKKIDAVKKSIVEACDDYRDRTRQPLTDWEEAIKQIEAQAGEVVKSLIGLSELSGEETSVELGVILDSITMFEISNTLGDHCERLNAQKETALTRIKEKIAARLQHEKDQAELAKLREEAAERQRKEEAAKEAAERKAQEEKRIADEKLEAEKAAQAKVEYEAKVKKEAEAKAKEDAEKAIKAQQEKAEADRREATRKQEESDQKLRDLEEEKKATAIKAEQDKKAAVALAEKNERERIELAAKEKEAKEMAEARIEDTRIANKKHRVKVQNGIVEALVTSCDITNLQAMSVVDAISSGAVKYISIKY